LQAEHAAEGRDAAEGRATGLTADRAAWESELSREEGRLEGWNQDLLEHQTSTQSR
jgi:hypothetical protein